MHSKLKKNDIKSLSRNELMDWLNKNEEKSFRANQIFKWLYQKNCDSFDAMSDLSKRLKDILKQTFSIHRLEIKSIKTSEDGSKKYAFKLSDNNIIESLLIPEKNHFTLCISSQVGCAQKCKFCMTARSGLVRHLSSGEIVAQVRDIQKESKIFHPKPLSNIVLMGMGEPLANYEQVVKALKIISDGSYGLKISPRRVTISTAGLIPEINSLSSDTNANLAVSLNAADNKTRNILMPINKIYPIEMLIEACRIYPLARRQKITFEYVLIQGVNDRQIDAQNLTTLLKNVKAKINLIPLNEHKGCKYRKSPNGNILKFQKFLTNKNYTATVRYSKGNDISGACGQLRAKHYVNNIE